MDLNKKITEAAATVADQTGISAADAMAMAAEHLQPVKEAVLDLPAQVYTLARVTLAARFIHELATPDGMNHGFNVEGFNQAWEYLTGEKAEETAAE